MPTAITQLKENYREFPEILHKYPAGSGLDKFPMMIPYINLYIAIRLALNLLRIILFTQKSIKSMLIFACKPFAANSIAAIPSE